MASKMKTRRRTYNANARLLRLCEKNFAILNFSFFYLQSCGYRPLSQCQFVWSKFYKRVDRSFLISREQDTSFDSRVTARC